MPPLIILVRRPKEFQSTIHHKISMILPPREFGSDAADMLKHKERHTIVRIYLCDYGDSNDQDPGDSRGEKC